MFRNFHKNELQKMTPLRLPHKMVCGVRTPTKVGHILLVIINPEENDYGEPGAAGL
jgi:hypothetical protein